MTTVTEDTANLPPEALKREIPLLATWILLGARKHKGYKGGDGYALEIDGHFKPVSEHDLAMASDIACRINHGYVDRMLGGKQILNIYRVAEDLTRGEVERIEGARVGVRVTRIVMLKDKGGAGYWRMVMPAREMERQFGDETRIDVTGGSVEFDRLMEYDTVFVQRLMDWESYYMLEKLKKAGKHIVYDIDDDIYSLSPDNPAFHVITRDNQQAAAACMKLADDVTTTTDLLADRLRQVVGPDISPVVIPNAIDTNDRWLPIEKIGSPDGWKRIYWQGSSTHEQDWGVCIEAVDTVMREKDNVRLVLLGYLPRCVVERLGQPHWKGRVEHSGFNKPETYFEIIHHVRADVAIAPLYPQTFNEAKSPIKWLEATCIGIPVLASDMEPYASVIEDGVDGALVPNDTKAWIAAINAMLTVTKDERVRMVYVARGKANMAYDIKRVAKDWREVLTSN